MQLFHWYSEALRQYGRGHIIVMAEDVTMAREAAISQFKKWIDNPNSPFSYLTYGVMDEDEKEEYNKILATLKEDILKDPLDNDGSIFIMGSE